MNTVQLPFRQKKPLHKTSSYKKINTPFLIKLLNWEYWSFNVIYTPIFFYWFYLCAKAKSFFFFSAANPSIEYGGFLCESKSDIYKLIPEAYYPKTLLIPVNYAADVVEHLIANANVTFPVIVKPNIGAQGKGVRKINNLQDAVDYIFTSRFPMLVQNFVAYENEVGIFYYRYPWEKNGKISGIVEKEFLTITGDGMFTVEELIKQNERYLLQLNALKKMKDINLSEVLQLDEKKILIPFGNHARGAKFIDASHQITPALENAIDNICKQIDGFYYGRLDIKFNSWEELEQGKALSIIELNGSGSEPTHMYDPKHSIFYAWKEIIRHLNILYKISSWVKKNKKGDYLTFSEGINMFKENNKILRKLDSLF
jgi:RimK-like ATP-grasp domain